MNLVYVPAAGQAPTAVTARQTTLSAAAFDPADPALVAFAGNRPDILPAVIAVTSQGILGDWLHDDGTLTAAAVNALGAPFAAGELTATNQAALLAKAAAALTNNATYQAIATPTNAQAAAQIAALTRQVTVLIRLAANLLDTIAGT